MSRLGSYVVLRARRGDDQRLRGLSLRAGGLLLRLMMTRTCTSFGALVAGQAALAEETGLSAKEFAEAFAELETVGLVLADWPARLVFITFMAEDDPPSNSKVAIGRGRVLGDLPVCDLRRRIAAECHRHSGQHADVFAVAASAHGGIDYADFEDRPAGIALAVAKAQVKP